MNNISSNGQISQLLFEAIATFSTPVGATEIAIEVGLGVDIVRNALNMLVKQGKLDREKELYSCRHYFHANQAGDRIRCSHCGRVEEIVEELIEIIAKEEVVTVRTEVVDEAKELQELEQVVYAGIKAMFAMGDALKKIRERRLYRLTHDTFDLYCQEKFGLNKDYCNKNIVAAEVYQNIVKSYQEMAEIDTKDDLTPEAETTETRERGYNCIQNPPTPEAETTETRERGYNCIQNPDLAGVESIGEDEDEVKDDVTEAETTETRERGSHGSQNPILPTSEGQVRKLAALPKEQQFQVWLKAVELSKGKPTGRIVEQIIKEQKNMRRPKRISDMLPETVTTPKAKIVMTPTGVAFELPVERDTYEAMSSYCQRNGFITFNGAIANLLK